EPSQAEEFGKAIAASFKDQNISLVASPAIGGIIIGHEVARALGARFLWTEREGGMMTLRRGFSVKSGEPTPLRAHVFTTGGSTRETIDALRAAGADVVGAASIIDRSASDVDLGVPRIALARLDVPAVSPAECEACARGDVAIKPGSRKG